MDYNYIACAFKPCLSWISDICSMIYWLHLRSCAWRRLPLVNVTGLAVHIYSCAFIPYEPGSKILFLFLPWIQDKKSASGAETTRLDCFCQGMSTSNVTDLTETRGKAKAEQSIPLLSSSQEQCTTAEAHLTEETTLDWKVLFLINFFFNFRDNNNIIQFIIYTISESVVYCCSK